MIATMLAVVSLLLPVVDFKGKKIDECQVRVGAGGTLTLLCEGNGPVVLDYKLGSRERLPKIRVEREEKRVKRIEIQPARELDWRPVAWVVLTVGAVWLGGEQWGNETSNEEKSVSPWR